MELGNTPTEYDYWLYFISSLNRPQKHQKKPRPGNALRYQEGNIYKPFVALLIFAYFCLSIVKCSLYKLT